MLTLSEQEVIIKIQNMECFECMLEDGSLTIRINDYQPYIATAIHHGQRLTKSLADKCLLTESERLYEEDPVTGDFISSLPIVLQAEDSRYEYDLNRHPEDCIYQVAWDKAVWETEHTVDERAVILRKHYRYYSILKVLLETLEKDLGSALFTMFTHTITKELNSKPLFLT